MRHLYQNIFKGEEARLVFHVFTAVELSVNISQPLIGHMGIDLSGGNIFVPQEFLNGS